MNLDPAVQTQIEEGLLEAGHGKALLGLPGAAQIRLAEQAIRDGWSVRELERRRALLAEIQPVALPTVRDPDPVSYTHLDVYKRQNQLLADLVETHDRTGRVVGSGIDLQHILHGAHELGIGLGRDHPLLL